MREMPFDLETYAARRNQLARALREHPMSVAARAETGANAVCAVVFTAPTAIRNNDVEHRFRPDSDLAWLTGFSEPGSVAVLRVDDDGHELVLFVQPKDRAQEVWTGRRAGVEGAQDVYGADRAFPVGELDRELATLAQGCGALWSMLGQRSGDDAAVTRAVQTAKARSRRRGRWPKALLDLRCLLHRVRQKKAPEEIRALERAAEASVDGHRRAMARCRPGLTERDLEAELTYAFMRGGAARHGYTPIVAAGENACVLHYDDNNAPLHAGDLVLIDAGAEVDLYTADITRTFPVSGTFSAPQREVYDVVLGAQRAAVAAAGPGKTLKDVDDMARRTLAEGLVSLGLLEGDLDTLVTRVPVEGKPPWHPGEAPLSRYYMHGTSHWLGMDVHDVGAYHDGENQIPLEPGMVFTVEPGIYIAPDDDKAPAPYRGIGVRIEDDVLVTESGVRVLTAGVPTAPNEIEALVGTKVRD